ncbi:hypothetical protein GIB67_036810 [Kingdonia uniflora]|uniref:Carbohydrate kinase PfkB domain-containing protein n=1 Tax=Kingdonia uniflora TaxID=39325 RepID=A0A7J7LWQ2_9MAGN|nr:hypothetical protein GIB67_036810 [Kingdonia uniflora]
MDPMTQNQLTNIETLMNSNYSNRKLEIQIALGYLDFDFVLTEAKSADFTDTSYDVEKVAYVRWVKANKMTNLIIHSSIDPIMWGGIAERGTVKELLDVIKKQFEGSIKGRQYSKLSQFLSLKYDGIWSLPQCFEMFQIHYQNQEKTWEMNELIATLVSEEERQKKAVGSANADIYVEIDRLPKEGETISAANGRTLAGAKVLTKLHVVGNSHYAQLVLWVKLVRMLMGNGLLRRWKMVGVKLDYLNTVNGVPTDHAVVMLQSNGQNSIIIVGGANMYCLPELLSDEDLSVVRNAGIVLLQREIPDLVNIQVAKAARSASVPVILDAREWRDLSH